MIKMRKFPILTILTLILYAISVNAAPSLKFVEDFVNISGGASSTASGSFTINNSGTTNLNINFTGYTLTRIGGTDQVSISSLNNITNMANGTTQTKSFSVVIPAQKLYGLYTTTLSATSNATPSATVEDSIIINVNVTPTYSVSTSPASLMNLGSASLNSTHTRNFSITNTGNADITNVSFDFSNSGFNLQANKTNFVLQFNATETIQFNITIPSSSSTGNVTLGSVTLASTEIPSATLFAIKAEVGGGLIIEDIDVFLTTRIRRSSDGILRSESGSDLDAYDGRKLNFDNENTGPESELRFNFNIENTFTDNENIDINDITVKVTIEGIDDGDDIEEESNEFDLDSDSNEDVDIIIKIPLSVDVGIYDIVIEVSGEDDDRNEHTAQMNLKVDIDKEARDVVVSKASLFPEKIKCSGSSTLTATIENIGSKTEEEAGIKIINLDLGINFEKQDIELEEDPFDTDNEFTKKLIIDVGRDTNPGTYPVTVNSYIHKDALWETKTVNLVVESCSTPQQQEEEQEEEINETETVETGTGTEGEATESDEISVLGPTTTTETPLTKKPMFWVGIILVNIALIVVVFFFVARLVRKK
jgi:uncharacterized OsmC-like protein